MGLHHKKILGVTLARGGSKGVPNKNIRLLKGRPLITYTIEAAKGSKLLGEYIISTDSHEIKYIAEKSGGNCPFVRPSNLATDTASSVAALQHAVKFMEEKNGIKYDVVVELMATNPFKTSEDIDACILTLLEKDADSVIAVHQLFDEHPARIKKITDGRLEDFNIIEHPESRRQDLTPSAYIRSGAIYALSRDHLMEEGRRYGSKNSYPYILDHLKSVNIDSERDFLLAESVMGL